MGWTVNSRDTLSKTAISQRKQTYRVAQQKGDSTSFVLAVVFAGDQLHFLFHPRLAFVSVLVVLKRFDCVDELLTFQSSQLV